MQGAFLKLWERWDRIGEIDDAVGYLFRVALNGFRMRARRARVAARNLVVVGSTPDPFDDVDLKEDPRRLMPRLTPRQRAAAVLTDVYGYSSEQAGQMKVLSVASGKVKDLGVSVASDVNAVSWSPDSIRSSRPAPRAAPPAGSPTRCRTRSRHRARPR